MTNYLLFPNGLEKALTLSYDDGCDTDKRLVELMKKYKIKGTFNICPGCSYPEGYVKPEGKSHYNLPKSELIALYNDELFEVATHGFEHPRLDLLPGSQLLYEVYESRKTLEEMFGTFIRGHAYPFGTYNDDVKNALRMAGIVYARTTESRHNFELPTDWMQMGTTCHHRDERLPELTNWFLNGHPEYRDGWLFYVWGHSFEFNNQNNWHVIENFFERVGLRDDIWYCTNIEAYEYITAYRSLIYSADGKKVYNPTHIDVWSKINDKKVFIPAGKTTEL